MIRPLLAAALLVALGWPIVRRLRPAWGTGATAAAAAVVALAAVVAVGFPLALAGVPPAAALLAGAAAAAALGLVPQGGELVPVAEPRPEPPWLCGASALVLLASAVVFVAKLARAPLWSWDHYAIWGVKTRRLLAGGALDLGFLAWPEAAAARPDHPLGVPLAWRILTLGERPEAGDFVVLHALAGVALLLVLRGAARAAAGSWTSGNLLAGALASSPLYWDTEAVGLAEMPLALCATAGAALLLAAGGGRRAAAAGGLVLGLLPWLKSEGFPLAVLALAAALWSSRSATGPGRRRWLPAVAACAAVGLGAWAIGRFVLPQGASFFLGDWWGRGVERLAVLPAIAAFCLEELLAADWLGFWPVLALASIAALALRRRAAAALAAAVWLQLAIYAATALFTYLEPVGHLRAAFFRIAAALVAPGLLAIAHLLAPAERAR